MQPVPVVDKPKRPESADCWCGTPKSTDDNKLTTAVNGATLLRESAAACGPKSGEMHSAAIFRMLASGAPRKEETPCRSRQGLTSKILNLPHHVFRVAASMQQEQLLKKIAQRVLPLVALRNSGMFDALEVQPNVVDIVGHDDATS